MNPFLRPNPLFESNRVRPSLATPSATIPAGPICRGFLLLVCAWLLLATTPLATSAAESEALGEQFLKQDTTWSGTKIITGVVVVGRGATLTIAPGSRILFKKVDRNRDGIGDSELRILGRILAGGTREEPIYFGSAEENPADKDWSYLLIFASGQKNLVQYCTFEHGFSGLQVHFSTATVSDCTFTNNNEGIRFGRAKLTFTHNKVANNNLGIRFTRMEGPVEIRHNVITANRIGVFLVPSGQNIVDFFEPGRTGRPWNEGHLEITANHIYDNREYNLNLGAKQVWDLKINGNWWNSTDPVAIKEKIYDHHFDSSLGKVRFSPFANKHLPETGVRQ